ncbi:MAG: efflux RND transporter permease subunit [Kiritimatiellae bacterium]|nr:efflux RND transporter permease subunit [Kiritimatiellia bacterium]MCO5061340.1 efflux RND transporter permease subunit [Kiritimatiellia bacterium]MCO6400150.1 efflux RND transporter permease subunit [Verrucomicrobiota bacterium]
MTLAELSIKRPVFAWMLMAGLIVFGAISLGRLGVSLMPDVDFPIIQIRTTWEGAAPEVLEAEIIDSIEQKVIAVEGVKELRSTIRQGVGTVELELELNRDIDAAVQEVQAAISQVRFPLGVDQPVISRNSADADPILFLGLSGKQSLRELMDYVDNFLIDQLQVIPGVGEVALGGAADRNLRIWADRDKLREHELTILDLLNAIRKQHVEFAAGYIENTEKEINVRTMGEGLSAEEVGNILIAERGGQPIYDSTLRIHDVARVEDGLADIRRVARMQDGQRGISISIRKQRGANEVAVGQAVKARIAELNQSLPDGMQLKVNVDITRFVEQSVKQTKEELLLAGLLTALICYLFLGNWSSSFNIILSIPTSIIGTFTILYFMGFTLNTFTLLGLALAIGIVVDDAIMMLENIVRHFHLGKNRVLAARDGAREITFAAIAATLAVIAIFLPVVFMSGVIGRFFFQFGVTITAAVALSLLEAVTLTPMRCSQFMQMSAKPGWMERAIDVGFKMLASGYRRVLGVALRVRWLVLIVAMLIFAISLGTATRLRREFVPPQDQSFIRLSMQMPVGSSLSYTDKKVQQVEAYLRTVPEIASFFVSIGGFNGTPNEAFAGITLVDKNKRIKGQSELIMQFRRDLASVTGVRFAFRDLSTRGLAARRSFPVEFNLRGPDYEQLDHSAREIMRRLEETGLVLDLDSSYRAGMPELRVWPDRDAATLRGVSMAAIGETVQAAIGGVREGKFTSGGRRYDVRLRLNPDERLNPEDVNALQVRTQYGELISLSEVVHSEVVPTVQLISRVNRQRAVSVTANLAPAASQADALGMAKRIARDVLPPGYTFNLEGGAQTFQESSGSLWFAFLLGIVAAYMVLASQFNSFVHPWTVLLALPFSISGAVWALYLKDQSLNLYSAIGIILLMGIVKKNSILLVEFTNKLRYEEKLSVHDAILRASPIRLRPILMTSLATIAAAIPLALGIGPGAETRMPMSWTIIGGVVVSTIFTLFVVPCAYSVMSRIERVPPTDHIEFDELHL